MINSTDQLQNGRKQIASNCYGLSKLCQALSSCPCSMGHDTSCLPKCIMPLSYSGDKGFMLLHSKVYSSILGRGGEWGRVSECSSSLQINFWYVEASVPIKVGLSFCDCFKAHRHKEGANIVLAPPVSSGASPSFGEGLVFCTQYVWVTSRTTNLCFPRDQKGPRVMLKDRPVNLKMCPCWCCLCLT